MMAALTCLSGAAFAQSNLGADCGCPTPVSSRPTVLLSTLAISGGADDGRLTATNTILDCTKNWILDKKIYVPNGKTITIQPGTVVKGRSYSTADSAVALTVEVGGKIIADGTETCQVVFTAEADNLDGTYPVSNKGKWGGICIAGKATNNLTLAANGPFQAGVGDGKICVADGLGTFEGFSSSNAKDQFGVNLTAGGVFNDDDNSGVLRYISIRHAGAILQVGGELNALSLGSVGRGTTIEHIEVISCADDAIEFWGGTVNVKYFSTMFGNDDMFDWDDGYKGKAQFLFGIKTGTTDTLTSVDADNGFEMDADDQKSNLLPRSHPVIYNATFISNNKQVRTSDNSGVAAIMAKELTEGEIYNSVFANWRFGVNLIKSLGTRTGTSEAYHNWANTGGNGSNSLIIKCNTFSNNILAPIAINSNGTGALLSTDTAQFYTTDKNLAVASIPGFTSTWAYNASNNTVTTPFDAVPNPALSISGCGTNPPSDGFFTYANYRGAFSPTNQTNWLSKWSYAQVLNVTPGLQACPTDINNDGITNNVDFLQLLGRFNQSCQ